ncbi:MAG TPA: penicillin-binding protein, partial [Campylobacterales bacterium]|nr:penicillin-binding protein [Campylobacterales bacterium]
NDYRDAWFCGFTPGVQTVIWFGNDDNKPLPGKMTGGVVAAPVFAKYTTELLLRRPGLKREFFNPGGSAEETLPENNTITVDGGASDDTNSSE